jgi:hypothetical protein
MCFHRNENVRSGLKRSLKQENIGKRVDAFDDVSFA